jgi:hypothetical protein
MQHLKGILLSIGRVATKAVADTISRHTDTDVLSWKDTERVLSSPRYYLLGSARPFVLIYHSQLYFEKFKWLINELPDRPIAFSVRDPIEGLKAYARATLLAFISGHYQEYLDLMDRGQLLTLSPAAVERDFVPVVNYWKFWQAIESHPNMVVDFSDFGEARFSETMTRICDFLDLDITTPIAWSGRSNTEFDTFLINYQLPLNFLDRDVKLFFSREEEEGNVSRNGPGLLPVGTFQSERLDAVLGPGTPLHVHMRADDMLSFSEYRREKEAFTAFACNPQVKDQLAGKLLTDFEVIKTLADAQRESVEQQFLEKFSKTYEADLLQFLRAHPWLEEKWQCVPLLKAA